MLHTVVFVEHRNNPHVAVSKHLYAVLIYDLFLKLFFHQFVTHHQPVIILIKVICGMNLSFSHILR